MTIAVHPIELGGSTKAIQRHYDVGNEFFASWLDPSMTYSCAMWDGPNDDAPLEEAQLRKLRYHANAIGAKAGMRVLDIGCGWGAQMRCLTEEYGIAACVGLTQSDAQAGFIQAAAPTRTRVEVETWLDYTPDQHFDGIISVGAFAHFAHPSQSDRERRDVYRRFFQSCLDWTDGKGRLSLQTIAYGKMSPSSANPFITSQIFPGAELPTLEDIVIASQGIFKIALLRDDGKDYARTCQVWASRLRRAEEQGTASPDPALNDKFRQFLRLSAAGFAMGKIGLLRIRFEPIRSAVTR